MVVTRFPPSPTGELHIGGARTALFNWLFSRHHGGRFVLRIEDTDRERSTEAATQQILEAMDWLGLDWDEGPYYQSQRLERYRAAIDRLLERGEAYWCHCSPETLEAKRKLALSQKRKPVYDRTCRNRDLGPAEGAVVRLKAPRTGATVFDDKIMGPIRFENLELDDLVLLRSDGSPTYHLACVVDDIEMGVNHVIRGQDHVNNTPRQIMIYNGLGVDLPVYAHVPMIHGPDGHKLSKRHGATSVLAYREMGILPEALLNYLVRLGWSHGDQEIFSREELVRLFDLDSVGRSPGVFNPDKLLWLNANHLKEAGDARLASQTAPFLRAKGVEADQARLAEVIGLFKPRAKTLLEVADQALFLFQPPSGYEPKGEQKFFKPQAGPLLAELAARLAGIEFSEAGLEELFRSLAEEKGLKLGEVAQPTRLALTGRTTSPGLFEVMTALGKEECLRRLDRARAHVEAKAA